MINMREKDQKGNYRLVFKRQKKSLVKKENEKKREPPATAKKPSKLLNLRWPEEEIPSIETPRTLNLFWCLVFPIQKN